MLAICVLMASPWARAEQCVSYGDEAWNGKNPYAKLASADPRQTLNLDVWSVGSHWKGGWVNLCSHAGPHRDWSFRAEWQLKGRIVQAYPHIVRGWDWFHWLPHDSRGADGFPLRVAANGLHSEVEYDPRPLGGMFDVSYDIWLSDKPEPGPADKITEIMIWLSRGGGLEPLKNNGGDIGTRTIDHVHGAWDVYVGKMNSTYQGIEMRWPVYSFVSHQPLSKFDGDLAPFIWQAIHQFQQQGQLSNHMDDHWYVLGVQFGAEPVSGHARLDVWRYSVQPAH
jgi:hypothetical protein